MLSGPSALGAAGPNPKTQLETDSATKALKRHYLCVCFSPRPTASPYADRAPITLAASPYAGRKAETVQDSSLQNGRLQDSSPQDHNLQDSSLEGSHLQGSNLQDSSLQGSNLHGSNLNITARSEVDGSPLPSLSTRMGIFNLQSTPGETATTPARTPVRPPAPFTFLISQDPCDNWVMIARPQLRHFVFYPARTIPAMMCMSKRAVRGSKRLDVHEQKGHDISVAWCCGCEGQHTP